MKIYLIEYYQTIKGTKRYKTETEALQSATGAKWDKDLKQWVKIFKRYDRVQSNPKGFKVLQVCEID